MFFVLSKKKCLVVLRDFGEGTDLSPRGPLVFKGGYDARTRKQVKRVVFFQQSVYARTLKRVSKTAKV